MPMKYPPHPGRSILRDCMEPLGMDVVETAQKLGVGPEELSSVIRGESAITFALAHPPGQAVWLRSLHLVPVTSSL